MKNALRKLLMEVKLAAYEAGYRPRPGNILYSPSLSWIYWVSDNVTDVTLTPWQKVILGNIAEGKK